MAVTKIYAITKNLWYSVNYAANTKKTGLDGVIEYAVNPDKTEKRLFQSCLNCKSIETAYEEMRKVKLKWQKEDGVLGYHFIQSFEPGETTPEEAHEIGKQLAEEMLGGKYEYILSTQVDYLW